MKTTILRVLAAAALVACLAAPAMAAPEQFSVAAYGGANDQRSGDASVAVDAHVIWNIDAEVSYDRSFTPGKFATTTAGVTNFIQTSRIGDHFDAAAVINIPTKTRFAPYGVLGGGYETAANGPSGFEVIGGFGVRYHLIGPIDLDTRLIHAQGTQKSDPAVNRLLAGVRLNF